MNNNIIENKIVSYQKLKEQLLVISSNLKQSYEHLSICINRLPLYYRIDGGCNITKMLELHEKMYNDNCLIETKYLPEIENQIKILSEQLKV